MRDAGCGQTWAGLEYSEGWESRSYFLLRALISLVAVPKGRGLWMATLKRLLTT